jgi:hypothetical protein
MQSLTTVNVPEQQPSDVRVKVETPEQLVDITDKIQTLKIGVEPNKSTEHRNNYSFVSKEPRFILDYRAKNLQIPNPSTNKHIVHTREGGEKVVYETGKLMYCEIEHDVRQDKPVESYIRIETTYERKTV